MFCSNLKEALDLNSKSLLLELQHCCVVSYVVRWPKRKPDLIHKLWFWLNMTKWWWDNAESTRIWIWSHNSVQTLLILLTIIQLSHIWPFGIPHYAFALVEVATWLTSQKQLVRRLPICSRYVVIIALQNVNSNKHSVDTLWAVQQ